MSVRRGSCALIATLAAGWLTMAPALARPYLPPHGHVFAGVTGGTTATIGRWQRLVGKHPPVFEIFMTWNTPTGWLAGRDLWFRSRLGLAVGTSYGYGQPGVISPEAIAVGRSDRFLLHLGRDLAHSGRIAYVRIMGEMNGYWNAYAAFAADGTARGPQNSPYFYKQAFRRTALILRGGSVGRIDRRLRMLGLPPLQRVSRRARLPRPKVALLWVPQDAGSPDVQANRPAAFWPGGAYVDWVGTDFYASYPNFRLLEHFYDEFQGKPFVISEWGLDGSDDPGFVRAVFAWVNSHPRVRLFDYYVGFGASSPSDLARFPRSRKVMRQELRARRYLAYPTEYRHRRRHSTRGGRLLPPTPAAPPGPPPGVPGPGPLPGLPPVCVPGIGTCVPSV